MTEITLLINIENAISPVQGNEKSTVYLEANIHPMLCVSHYHLFIFQKYTRLAGNLQSHSKE